MTECKKVFLDTAPFIYYIEGNVGNAFERLLTLTGVEVIDIDKEIAEKAAKIRAEYRNFKSMDALQLATACVMGCDLFLTNDKQLRQFKEMKCVTIEELE